MEAVRTEARVSLRRHCLAPNNGRCDLLALAGTHRLALWDSRANDLLSLPFAHWQIHDNGVHCPQLPLCGDDVIDHLCLCSAYNRQLDGAHEQVSCVAARGAGTFLSPSFSE